MNAIPLADTPALRRPAQVTFLTRGALAAAAVAIGLAFLLGSRHPQSRTVVLLPAHADTVLVLDLSASIDSDTFSGIGGTLAAFSRSDARVGLVCFSDDAYEALPLGTAAVDLAPLVRYFTLPPQKQADFARSFPRNPWEDTFSGGTRISAGMELAHEIAVSSAPSADGRARERPRGRPRRSRAARERAPRLPSRPGDGADRQARPLAVGRHFLSNLLGSTVPIVDAPALDEVAPLDPTAFPLSLVALTAVGRLGDRAPRAVGAEALRGRH